MERQEPIYSWTGASEKQCWSTATGLRPASDLDRQSGQDGTSSPLGKRPARCRQEKKKENATEQNDEQDSLLKSLPSIIWRHDTSVAGAWCG
jgi:hypothetical protein